MFVLGYDPGGAGKNAVALLDAAGPVVALLGMKLAESVDDAIEWVADSVGQVGLAAVGIDSPLYWSARKCGWRACDEQLKRGYPQIQNSVFSTNSARGSVAVQGPLMATLLRNRWPDVCITETHPKLAYFALRSQEHDFESKRESMCDWLALQIGLTQLSPRLGEDEWDALFSAWAAMQGFRSVWPANLIDSDTGGIFAFGPVNYFWPSDIPKSER